MAAPRGRDGARALAHALLAPLLRQQPRVLVGFVFLSGRGARRRRARCRLRRARDDRGRLTEARALVCWGCKRRVGERGRTKRRVGGRGRTKTRRGSGRRPGRCLNARGACGAGRGRTCTRSLTSRSASLVLEMVLARVSAPAPAFSGEYVAGTRGRSHLSGGNEREEAELLHFHPPWTESRRGAGAGDRGQGRGGARLGTAGLGRPAHAGRDETCPFSTEGRDVSS